MDRPNISRGCQLLKRWRGDRAQSEVCGILGLDPPTYSKIEGGIRRPGGRVAARIDSATHGEVDMASWWSAPVGRPPTQERAA